MAEHILETRIVLRYATYTEWMGSTVVLKRGEAAIAAFPRERVLESLSNSRPENTPPAIGIKIGDGVNIFRDLPWVLGIAADVYNWAKASYKPTYTALEIEGLLSFVESLVGGDVNVTIAPRVYQIVRGTGNNINKYYLRYKENNDESEWVIDTSSYIDLEDLTKLVNWVERSNLDDYSTLIERTAELIQYFIEQLNYSNSVVENQFVTAVSETNGIISVSKARPTFENISGILSVEQGGTGLTSITQNHVLVGTNNNTFTTLAIADTIENNNNLVPNYLIKRYVDNAVAGILGAMHFIGEATVAITGAVDPRIAGYIFSRALAGDVILWDDKEYVWDGNTWILLGDEGSYAVKGSIKNVDIADDAEIAQSKIANLVLDLSSKVDKIEGKSLSTNDYTTAEKTKLSEIEEHAQRNIIEHIFVNGIEQLPTVISSKANSIALVINSFDETRAAKLDSIEYGANVNKIEHIFVNGTEINPTLISGLSKSVNITFNSMTDAERTKLASIETNAQVNKIESLIINGTSYYPNNSKAISLSLTASTLNLDIIEGAQATYINTTEDLDVINKKIQLAYIAKTGDVAHLKLTVNTYIILNCGSSTDVI